MLTTYLKYGLAFHDKLSPAFDRYVKERISQITNILSKEMKKWEVATPLAVYSGLTVGLERICEEAGATPCSPYKFVLFADNEQMRARLGEQLRVWPNNVSGIVVLAGEKRDNDLLSSLTHEVGYHEKAKF